MDTLPIGTRTLEDLAMIEQLCKDDLYKMTMEETVGKITRMWADWSVGLLFYELYDGSLKQSKLDGVLKKLREINYMKEFGH